MKSRTLGAWVGAMLLLFLMSGHVGASEAFITFEAPKPIPAFQLHDHQGELFGPEHLRHAWSLVFLGFTACPDVCPVTMMKLEAVRAEMGLRFPPDAIPQVIFLAVDPARDQPVLAQYLAHFHPQNIGVTGEPEQLDQFTKSLGGFYRIEDPKPGSDYYNVVHTAAIAVINPEAEVVASMNPPFHVHAMAEYLTHLIRKGPTDE